MINRGSDWMQKVEVLAAWLLACPLAFGSMVLVMTFVLIALRYWFVIVAGLIVWKVLSSVEQDEA